MKWCAAGSRTSVIRRAARSCGRYCAGKDEGLGVDQIATNIARNVSGIAKARGALIARTETHGAANNGANAAARQTGLQLKKEWITAEDARTRSVAGGDEWDHVEIDGAIVAQDEKFRLTSANGTVEFLDFPGDPAGSAANVINCRCAVGYVVDDTFDASA